MKKLLAAALALVMVFCFAACGANNQGNEQSGTNGSSSQNENAGGTQGPTSQEGGGENAASNAQAGQWPDNDYTAQLPQLPQAVSISDSVENKSEGSYTFNFSTVSLDELAAYTQTLKDEGFASTGEDSLDTLEGYRFEAVNTAGYRVLLSRDSLVITRPGSANSESGQNDQSGQSSQNTEGSQS
ncbi:MAG: hypothetical protein Q4B42_01195 [Oscillospiraceae bacterium]|nr:hypothetical protein [Oscillospiraceae bacterium]